MKFKLMPIVTGMIAGTAIAIAPLTALAQGSTPQAPAQQTPAPQTQQRRPRIVLTSEQEAKFKQLQANAITQIEGVLTADQKKQFADGRASGQGLGAIQNLSGQQETKIKSILEAFNSQVGDLLTAEQKRQIQQSQPNQ